MKLPASRWLVLLMLALAGGTTFLIATVAPTADRYSVPFAEIECGPLPPHVPADFLQDVRQRSSLLETLDTRQPQLLEQLHTAFRQHPRVADVKQVRLASSRRIVVELRFREPVAMVHGEQPWVVDALGVLLPPVPEAVVGSLLPIEGVRERPPVLFGQAWPVVQPAATVAAMVRRDRDTLRFTTIVVSNDPLQPTVQVRTTGGSLILWCNLRAMESENAEDKLRLLREYVAQYGSLDAPEGPYRFDVRTPRSGLLRQQIVP